MNESFGSGKVESPAEHARRMEREAKKRYEALPGARPRMFPSEELGEGNESPFAFPPKVINMNQESIESILNATYDETQLMYLGLQKRLDKLQMGTAVLGEYEVSYIMRAQGDMNRIDKMIDELDADHPWQAGKFEHLLLLAQTSPELFDMPVVALGSEIKQSGDIPCLRSKDGQVGYSSHPRAAGFNRNYCFLVVRPKQ